MPSSMELMESFQELLVVTEKRVETQINLQLDNTSKLTQPAIVVRT